MGLDIKFFVKEDDGTYEEIASYRDTGELLYWIKVHKYDQREAIQGAIDPDDPKELYDLIKVSEEEIKDLVDRAKTTLENDPMTSRFSGGYCLLPRVNVEAMKKLNDEELERYLEDVKDYIETFEPLSEDVYIYLSY